MDLWNGSVEQFNIPIATMLFAKLMPRSNSCEFPRSFRGRGSLNQVKGESLAVVCSSKGFVVGPMSQKREPLLAKIVVKPLQEFQTAVLQIAPLEEQRNAEAIFKILPISLTLLPMFTECL